MDLKGSMKRYLKDLKKRYGEAAEIVIIVKTAMITYPVLQFYGFFFTNPIAIIVDKMNILRMLIWELGGCVLDGISSAITNSELKKEVKNRQFEMLPILYRKSPNANKNIQFLSDMLFSGNMLTDFQKAVIIAFCGEIPIECRGYIAGKIRFKTDGVCTTQNALPSAEEFYYCLVKHVCTQANLVELKFKELNENEEDKNGLSHYPGMEVFYAAEKILETIAELESFSVEEKRELKCSFLNALDKMKKEWNLENPEQEWADTFRELMFEKSEEISDILERDKITGTQMKLIDQIDQYPVFDEEFYYISEELFAEICVPISQTISLDKLKELLASAEMLKGEGKSRQYWTVKVKMISVYGEIPNKRMIRLVRKKVDEGHVKSWKEVIQKNVIKDISIKKKEDMIFWHDDNWHTSQELVNKHILFLGQSGCGKTVALKKVEEKLAVSNYVLALNFSQTHNSLDEPEKENLKWINVREEGIPLSLFGILESIEDKNFRPDLLEILADIFDGLVQLGSHQRKLLIQSLDFAAQNLSGECNEIEQLLSALQNRSKEGAQGILDRIKPKLRNIRMGVKSELWEQGKISVLDFSDFPESTQFFCSNLVMFILWNQQKREKMEDRKEIWISCDEFHSLKMGEKSVLTQVLREGRKYKFSLLLATQTLGYFDRASKNLLLQAGTKFYFSTEDKEIWNEIKTISELSENKLNEELRNFQRGECFAVGDFIVNHNGQEGYRKILKFSFREDTMNTEKTDGERM